MTPKYVSFSISLIESPLIKKVVSAYVEGLEQMLVEDVKTINRHEELLSLQQSEIEYFKDEVDNLAQREHSSDRVIEDYESDIEKLEEFIDELRSQIEDLEYELSNERR